MDGTELSTGGRSGLPRGGGTRSATEAVGVAGVPMLSSSSLSIVTRSDAVRAVIARVDTIADSDTSVMRVGGSSMIPVDVRLITASKVDLKELVQRNAFRS